RDARVQLGLARVHGRRSGKRGGTLRVSGVHGVCGMIATHHHRRAPLRMRVSRQFRVVSRVVAILVAVALASGCSFFNKDKTDPLETYPVDQLYEKGKSD